MVAQTASRKRGHMDTRMMRARPKSPWEIQREIVEVSKPYVDMALDVLNRSLPAYTYNPETGELHTKHSEEVAEMLRKIDELKQEAIRRILPIVEE